MKNIKIFVSYHKDTNVLQTTDIITPIQVGRAGSDIRLDMRGDDEGDNISKKNDKYCELTAQYWAWKNVDADYYGFMHYRRHFVFRNIIGHLNQYDLIPFEQINKEYIETIGLTDKDIRCSLEGYDIILPPVSDVKEWGAVSTEVQYDTSDGCHAVDFDTACQIVTELYPEYEKYVLKFRMGHRAVFYNMFIMKKELFEAYCQWIFSVLEKVEEQIDFLGYDSQERRAPAILAERLFDIWLMKLVDDRPELRIKNLQVTFISGIDGNVARVNSLYKEIILEHRTYSYFLERAYRELKELTLPYNMEELFVIKRDDWEKLFRTSQIIFYGGGGWCRQFLNILKQLKLNMPLQIWDKRAEVMDSVEGISIVYPTKEVLSENSKMCVVITIGDKRIRKDVKQYLLENEISDIVFKDELSEWLAYKLWRKIQYEGCKN